MGVKWSLLVPLKPKGGEGLVGVKWGLLVPLKPKEEGLVGVSGV